MAFRGFRNAERRGHPAVFCVLGVAADINGVTQIYFGTSAVAPLWAALAALINQQASPAIGFFLPYLYDRPTLNRDISQGNNMPAWYDARLRRRTWLGCMYGPWSSSRTSPVQAPT